MCPAQCVHDADLYVHPDMDCLGDLLALLAACNGHRTGDGGAQLDVLRQITGIDLDGLAEQVASIPDFGALAVASYVERLSKAGPATEQPHVRAPTIDWIAISWATQRLATGRPQALPSP